MKRPLDLKKRWNPYGWTAVLLLFIAGWLNPLSAEPDYTNAYKITTWLGDGRAGRADTRNQPSFDSPMGVAVDRGGNVFVADTGNHCIRKIGVNGIVTTIAGATIGPAAEFSTPRGVATDGEGNIYVADSEGHRIRKITPAGVITTLAGSRNYGSADGTGEAAGFNSPDSLVVDAGGNVYVADTDNDLIRKITPSGVVTTLAGALIPIRISKDGIGTAARFEHPTGITLDGSGNLYVMDSYSSRIRKITPDAVVTTIPWYTPYDTGTPGAPTAAEVFYWPTGIAVDGGGNLYLAFPSNHKILKVTPQGVCSTFAGRGTPGNVDGKGIASALNAPHSVAVDAGGNVIVADTGNHDIRKITPAGDVSTVMGDGMPGRSNGDSKPSFNLPNGIAMNAAGFVYVADTGNHRIRKISPAGVVTTLAGSGSSVSADGTGTAAGFEYPIALALDGRGNVYVADAGYRRHKIRKITPEGVVTTLAGSDIPGVNDGVGQSAGFWDLQGIAVDSVGNVYATDNDRVRQITAGGVVTTLFAGQKMFDRPLGITVDADDNILVGDAGSSRILRITPARVVTTLVEGISAYGMALDAGGNLFIATRGSIAVKVTPAGAVRTIAGAINEGNVDGTGEAARFRGVNGIAVAADGTVYLSDHGNYSIRKGIPVAQQSITFGALPVRTVGDDPFTLSATSSSGLPVSYSIVAGYGAISGDRLTLDTGRAGPVTVRASQPGNEAFAAAPHVDQVFDVVRRSSELSKLTFGSAKMIPALRPGLFEYTVSVGKKVGYLDLSPVAAHVTSVITINGTTLKPGVNTMRVPISRAVSTITIVVQPAPLGFEITTQKSTYKIMVIRGPSPITTLSGLVIRGIPDLKFTTYGTSYWVKVPNATKSINMVPVLSSHVATMKVNGQPLKSGAVSKKIPLKPGKNTIIITVTAQNKNTRNYEFFITRSKTGATAPAAAVATGGKTVADPLAAYLKTSGLPLETLSGITVEGRKKYRTLTVYKSAVSTTVPVVEVSPNLMDWYSGKNHTTVLRETTELLQVRDNTPLQEGTKRHIRVR